jgi:hypothetical protein
VRLTNNEFYRMDWRFNRRRNCLTDTTRTRFRWAILIKSRSRLRSSSRVTRYRDWPAMAASRISSSSGSRQIFSSPEIWTTVARAAINRTNLCASRFGYRNRRTNRGLMRTSAISPSCESAVTTLNLSCAQAAMISPGGPVGLRKAETQTLVSSRATSGTAVCLYLGPGLGDLRLDLVLRSCFRAALHAAQQSIKFAPPLALGVECDQYARLFLQSKAPQRSQDAFLINHCDRLFIGMYFFWEVHALDYNDQATDRQATTSRQTCWRGRIR